MPLNFHIVDVFSDHAFLGNPVAVLLGADELSAEQMMSITRWMNLSETAFILEPDRAGADYRVRIFTLNRELPFAGHPTLGSAAAWLSTRANADDRQTLVQSCEAGLIDLRRTSAGLAFAAPPLVRYEPASADERRDACQVLGISESDVLDAHWVDNGPGWLGIRLASAEAVLAVDANAAPGRQVDIGLVGPTAGSEDYDFEVRALFSDHHGNLIEDPVTGSLNAAVGHWLLDSGVASAPFRCGQGGRVGRRGRISVDAEDGTLWIGGATQLRVSGQIDPF